MPGPDGRTWPAPALAGAMGLLTLIAPYALALGLLAVLPFYLALAQGVRTRAEARQLLGSLAVFCLLVAFLHLRGAL